MWQNVGGVNKILAILANYSYAAKISPTKILPLNTEFLVPVIIISCKHGGFVEILSLWT